MKQFLIAFLTFLFIFTACDKNEENDKPGTVEFSFSVPTSSLKSANLNESSDIAFAIVTIKDSNGELIYNNEELPIYKMGDSYITKPLSLEPGSFELTGFLVANETKTITYATPTKDSKLSYLVNNPLPIKFNLDGDQVLKLNPEVISSIDVNPTEFGYSTFTFNIVNTFKINVAAFLYSDSAKNFVLTNAVLNLNIQEDAINQDFDLSKQTNSILLPEKQSSYKLTATKNGYDPISVCYTLESIKAFQDKPLMFIFNNDTAKSLVAYYPFNNNTSDYSGYYNHGMLAGAVASSDRFGNSNSSYKFDGVDDYIKIPNSSSLNPTEAITVSAWYKTTPFEGSGNDGLVSKGYTSHVTPFYQYQLGVGGNSYWNGGSGFGFSVSLDGTYTSVGTGNGFYELYKWYHVVGTYDGSSLKMYVNGNLIKSIAASGKMQDYGSDLFIGRHGNRSDYYNTTFHLPGTVDDVRIYNRALSSEEISKLYNGL